jgi:hypothetical protein
MREHGAKGNTKQIVGTDVIRRHDVHLCPRCVGGSTQFAPEEHFSK